MPGLDDFHAFQSTSGGTDGGGFGCLTWLLILFAILSLIAELAY